MSRLIDRIKNIFKHTEVNEVEEVIEQTTPVVVVNESDNSVMVKTDNFSSGSDVPEIYEVTEGAEVIEEEEEKNDVTGVAVTANDDMTPIIMNDVVEEEEEII